MKHFGIFSGIGSGLVVLLVFVGSAAATTLTSPTGTTVTPTIKAESEGHLSLHNSIWTISCASAFEGNVASHGKEVPVSVSLTAFSITNCTDSWVFDVVAQGTMTIHWTSSYSGTVTSTGMTLVGTRSGISCYYQTQNTHIGTITGGTPATLHLEGLIPRHGGSSTCGGSTVALTGSYKVASPTSLFVDEGETSHPSSGTTITSPTGTIATPSIKAEGEGHVVLHNDIADIECASTLEGKVESHGGGAAASGKLSEVSFTSCTNNWVVDLVSKGEVAVDWSSGYNGTVRSSGMTITATRFGVSCNYQTENTHIGTITGGTPATLHLAGSLPRHGGSFLCGGAIASWTGTYKVTSPSSLYVDKVAAAITSPTGTVATLTVKAESEGHVTIDHPIAGIQCKWALEGTVESHAGNAVIPLASLTTSSCTDSWHTTTVSSGSIEIIPTSGYNGTVIWDGGTVEMTRLGTTCRYKTEDTHLGTITGGSPATIHIKGSIPFHSGSSFCGEEAHPLTGSLKVSSPGSLYVDKVS
jgi:hypothetical protein